MAQRATARQLAKESLQRGKPLEWFEDFIDTEDPPVRRFRVEFRREKA